jgi:hypothetical protein
MPTITFGVPNVIGSQPGPTIAAALFDQNWAALVTSANALSTVVDGLSVAVGSAPPLRGYLAGLTLTRTSGTSLTVEPGMAVDSTNTLMLTLAAAMTKTTGAWAAGTGNGGGFAGAAGGSGSFHWFLIRHSSGSIDCGFDTSVVAANIPAGYTAFRRIGSRVIIAGVWHDFVQDGDDVWYRTVANDISVSNPGIAAVLRALPVPTGIKVMAHMRGILSDSTVPPANNYYFSATDPDITEMSVNPNIALLAVNVGINNNFQVGAFSVRTNVSAQIRTRVNANATNLNFTIGCQGFTDTRNRLA